MSKIERQCTPEVLTDQQLESVSGGQVLQPVVPYVPTPVVGGIGEYDPHPNWCGTHPGVKLR